MSTTEKLTAEMERIIRARIEADRLVLPAFPATATRCVAMLKDPNAAGRGWALTQVVRGESFSLWRAA